MSIQQNFPTISPSLSINFARSKTLDPRITFTRTTSGTRTNGGGLVEVVPANSPRFDHSYDPVSGSVRSLGLLVEEQRSNLLSYSEDFSNVAWSKSQTSIITTSIIAPNGSNAYKLVENNVNSGHHINQGSISKASNAVLTLTIFVKAAERQYLGLVINDASGFGIGRYGAEFNLGNGTASQHDPAQGTYTSGSFSIEKYPNDWYRCRITCTTSTEAQSQVRIFTFIDTNQWTSASAYQGDGTSGIYIWGAQVEQGSFPTSYIPTTNSTVTRTADNVSMTGENFSSWYNQSEGTVYADTKMVGVQTGRYDRLWAITNSNLNLEGISVFVAGPAGTPSGYLSSVTITNSATEQVGGTLVETALTTPRLKSAFAFKQNDCASAYNGQQRFVDSIVDLSTFTTPLDRLLIGQPQRFQGHSCMTISQLIYYPRRLTNSQLQNLTK